MTGQLLRAVVLAAVLGLAGCYTTVTRAEFRKIVMEHRTPNDVELVDSDADYDYYRVGSKTYRIAHREKAE